MRVMNHALAWLTGLALLAGPVAGSASGAAGDTSLGRDGYTYQVRSDSYERLIGIGIGGESGGAVGLTVTSALGKKQVFIVPGTEDFGWEYSPRLIYVEGIDTAFLLWDDLTNGIHSELKLASFNRHAGFSEVLTLAGSTFAQKLDPQFLVVRDEIGLTDEDGIPTERTFVHLVWREDSGAVLYCPVLLSDGSLEPAIAQPLRLDTLFGPGNAIAGPGVDPLLELRPGAGPREVVVGVLDPAAGRIRSIEIRLLPGSISELANGARDSVLAGAALDLPALASAARAHIINVGRVLHPLSVAGLAAAAESFVLENAGVGQAPVGLADAARAHIINVGARLDREGLTRAHDPRPSRYLELTTEGIGSQVRSHDLELRSTFDRQLPAGDAPIERVLWSADGAGAVLVWIGEYSVTYRVGRGQLWSELRELAYGSDRSLDEVLALIAESNRSF